MFIRNGARSAIKQQARHVHSEAGASTRRSTGRYLLVAGSAATAVAVCTLATPATYADASVPALLPKPKEGPNALTNSESQLDAPMNAIVFGSNKSNILCPGTPSVDSVRTPSVTKWLENVALRDLRLHESHAACVDARGDVYQWGDGFFGSVPEVNARDRTPVRTLQGLDIVSLQVTECRVFALSKSGHVYTVSSEAAKQIPSVPTPQTSSWFGPNTPSLDYAEVKPNVSLVWGEKVVSIAAGKDHVLALTSTGRTFAHPISKNANKFGQLGFRKFEIPNPANLETRIAVQLVPRSVTDPFAVATPFLRPGEFPPYQASSMPKQPPPAPPNPDDPLTSIDDKGIRFCDRFFEINALKGISVAQIAAGSRSSFVNTTSGRVLGWGANDAGQIGLGNNVTVDTITVPTEVSLTRSTASSIHSRCTDIVAGGDLTCFSVERTDGTGHRTADLLLAGNGRWGGLGNNAYTSAQGSPVRAKYVSGLQEYSEKTNSLQAILPEAVSISPTTTGHILLTLNTLERAGAGDASGRDLWAWGANQDYQLGTGKRSSVAAPTPLQLPLPKSIVDKTISRPLSPEEAHAIQGSRFMLMNRKAKEVRDLQGKVWKRGVQVQQCAVAGYGNSLVYWKLS